MRVTEAMALIGCSRKTVWRALAAGDLVSDGAGGVDPSSIDSWRAAASAAHEPQCPRSAIVSGRGECHCLLCRCGEGYQPLANGECGRCRRKPLAAMEPGAAR